MSNKEIKIALLKEELNEFKESMKYQYGENYMDYPEVTARIEVIENMIKAVEASN
ncbi:hypothetical protein [Clostridium ganghwense]|uniref:50S ribosomal protein L29 n=1 Tax=Clostridium ganghwense TaxID=312089 RepID=A0ABT4CLR2_9CLOT|nr:hypothetical protein [Clostridium ganghwense]MCY6369984.1 hypothetical protein [Clostridium ganghwense]